MVVSAEQVEQLWEHAHVYLTKDGRISMAGLNEGNVKVGEVESRTPTHAHPQYFAESLSKVVKGELKPKASL